MGRYTIKIDVVGRIAQHAIDSASHAAVARFSDDLGEQKELTLRIARLAATNALEMFKAWCNVELRMIEADYERRADAALLHPVFIRAAKGQGS